ncbi:MAG: hypothetical protein WCP63_12495 [Cyanobium sp. ELA712]
MSELQPPSQLRCCDAVLAPAPTGSPETRARQLPASLTPFKTLRIQ